MAIPHHQQLAQALEQAQAIAIDHIVKSADLKGNSLNLLVKNSFLKRIVKGWYLLDADIQAENAGDSVLWQESYRAFVGQYLTNDFADRYHLTPEDSLDIHTGVNTRPTQMIAYVQANTRRKHELPGKLTLQTLQQPPKYKDCTIQQQEGVNILALPEALVLATPSWFRSNSLEAELALATVNLQALSKATVKMRNIQAAARLIGAYHAMGATDKADYLQDIMEKSGFDRVKYEIKNPFANVTLRFDKNNLPKSPYAGRIEALWKIMREPIIEIFPKPNKPQSVKKILQMADSIYVNDAYHSLSIEGYRVTPQLIEHVKNGSWNPLGSEEEKQQLDALAAKGYAQAFEEVKETISKILTQDSTVNLDHNVASWYSALFSPCVQAGIVKAENIAGYRNRPVYIRGSKHAPLPHTALSDAMEILFSLIAKEENPAVNAVLGHFLIGYIHPFPDGNGRVARFLMNTLLSASGYPWTIIRVENRSEYMQCLEEASCNRNIEPFAKFILEAMQ